MNNSTNFYHQIRKLNIYFITSRVLSNTGINNTIFYPKIQFIG